MSKYSQNQLFVGRLPRECKERDLEDIFYRYGKLMRCDVKTGKLVVSMTSPST